MTGTDTSQREIQAQLNKLEQHLQVLIESGAYIPRDDLLEILQELHNLRIRLTSLNAP